ncbi:MAG: methyltransferase domain-containing protein [Paludibacter sp.]
MRNIIEKISTQNRKRKFKLAISYIQRDDEIIDIGADPGLGGNINYFEKWFQLPNKLTCLGIYADFTKFKQKFPNFELIEFNGINFPTFEKKFEFAFSNAVIEHVGDYLKQVQWLSEVAKISKTLFVTTPNRWFPFETHSKTFFFHWFPERIRNYFYYKIGKSFFANNYMWLLGENDFKRALNDAGFEIISFKKNKFLIFTIDFVAICKS